jgi:hypothetical protein
MKKQMSPIEVHSDLRNFRFIGEEAESLGQRLDAARDALNTANSAWGRKYWNLVLTQLLFQWRALPALHDGDATTQIIPRWTVKYDFYFIDHKPADYGLSDKMFDEIFRTSLDESWERIRASRLARAQ